MTKLSFLRTTLFLFILTVTVNNAAYAGHGEHQRNNCKWYNKRFKANSHLWFPCLIPICYHHQGSCDDANTSCSAAGFGCTATSESHAGWGGCWGASNGCGGVCAGMASPLQLEFGNFGLSTGGEYYSATQRTNFLSAYKGDTVYVQGLSFSLQSDVNDVNANFITLTIWKPADDSIKGIEDTLITPEKTVQYGTVKLLNGVVSVQGTIFSQKDFRISRTGTTITVTYAGGDKKIFVKGMSTDAVTVETAMDGDIKNDVRGLAASYTSASEQKLIEKKGSLYVYPNPVKDVMTIENKIPGFNPSVIKIFDEEGHVVKEISNEKISVQYNISVGNLSPGTYFIMESDGKDKYLKTFLKE